MFYLKFKAKMIVQKFLIFLWFYCLISADAATLNYNNVVTLPRLGSLRGSVGQTAWTNRMFYQFRGVQYAESPSGIQRFKAPVPVKPWLGIRDAQNFGQKCPVIDDLLQMTEKEKNRIDLENCLNMAIYSPSLSGSLPVLFFVHGGGFYLHSATEYPPTYFLERDIILVVVQYRLDALGFLSTNSDDIPGNAGLLDVQLALSFVKENIAHFGGNPNSVTIFGQSSGAAMVSALTISPAVPQNLFHRVIIQSGTVFSRWSFTTDPVQDAKDIAAAVGLNSSQPIASLNKVFMKMSVFDLLSAVDRYMKDPASGSIKFGARSLCIGGPSKLLPDLPQKIVSSTNFKKKIPMIIGTTKDDGTYIGTVFYDLLLPYIQTVGPTNMDFPIVKVVLDILCDYQKYDADKCATSQSVFTSTFWTPEEIQSNDIRILLSGLLDLFGTLFYKADAMEQALRNAKLSNTFLYTFDYAGKETRYGYGLDTSHYPFRGGVTHSDDLIYLFPYPLDITDLNATDIQMAQKFLDLWTSFAANSWPKSRWDNEFLWSPLKGKLGPYAFIDKELKSGSDYPREMLLNVSKNRKTDYRQLIAFLFG